VHFILAAPLARCSHLKDVLRFSDCDRAASGSPQQSPSHRFSHIPEMDAFNGTNSVEEAAITLKFSFPNPLWLGENALSQTRFENQKMEG